MRLQSIRNIPRIGDITRILVRHGLHTFAEQLLGLPFVEQVRRAVGRSAESADEGRRSLPSRLRCALQDLGPTYVKLGQILSTRHDLLPEAFIVELAKLQDSVPPMPWDQVASLVQAELGRPPDELFRAFDHAALAAASIGQVHRAETAAGLEVVVKVQRRGIADVIAADVEILRSLARLMRENEVLDSIYDPVEIVEEFSRSIQRELDYAREARNILAFRQQFEGVEGVHIPVVHLELTTSRVLCMEFIRGVKASKVTPQDHDLKAIARNGVDAVLRQVFVHGCFHADPHPGNILIMDRSTVCFVDFGMVGRLSAKARDDLSTFLMASSTRDYDLLARELLRVAPPRGDVDVDELAAALMETLDPYYGLSLKQINVGELIRECLEVAARFRVRLPASYSLMLKALMTVESLGGSLDPDFDMMAAIRPFVEQLVLGRLEPKRLSRDASLIVRDLAGIAHRTPGRLDAVLGRLQRNELSVDVVNRGLGPLVAGLDEGSSRVAFSLVISALVMGASLLMTRSVPPALLGVNFAVLMFVGAGLLGLGLAFSIVRSGRP